MEEPDHVLLQSLAALGLTHEDIDVVVLSHLHFDHAGGLLSGWKEGQPWELLFPRATYVVQRGTLSLTTARLADRFMSVENFDPAARGTMLRVHHMLLEELTGQESYLIETSGTPSPGSGSGRLTGITGTLRLDVDEDGTHRYELRYDV